MPKITQKTSLSSRTQPYLTKKVEEGGNSSSGNAGLALATSSKGQNQSKRVKPRKQKKKPEKNHDEVEDVLIDVENGISTAYACMDPPLLADYVAQKIARAGRTLSSVEISDMSISASIIYDTISFQSLRTLENMAEFVEQFALSKDLTKEPDKTGCPHTVIVAGAGLRAADVVRAMRKFQTPTVKVAKCFAKHIKIKESEQFLNSHKISIAVGTPQRLIDLVENGALKLDNLDQIVVDASHIDEKKRGVLDMKETLLPLCKFLKMTDIKQKFAGNSDKSLRLMFY